MWVAKNKYKVFFYQKSGGKIEGSLQNKTQVMIKGKAMSQIDNLTLDH
jgi:hypothetical protein